jgi:hypothetical protein
MSVTIDHFRKEAARRKRGVRRGASGYPAELRRFAVAFATEAFAGGGTVGTAARELGVSEVTLSKWMDGGEVPDDREGSFREVIVEEVIAPRAALSLLTPAGYRVEGLDLPSAAALLKALG